MLDLYTIHCIEMYRRNGWKKDILSEYYADDFADFTEEMFDLVSKETARALEGHTTGEWSLCPQRAKSEDIRFLATNS